MLVPASLSGETRRGERGRPTAGAAVPAKPEAGEGALCCGIWITRPSGPDAPVLESRAVRPSNAPLSSSDVGGAGEQGSNGAAGGAGEQGMFVVCGRVSQDCLYVLCVSLHPRAHCRMSVSLSVDAAVCVCVCGCVWVACVCVPSPSAAARNGDLANCIDEGENWKLERGWCVCTQRSLSSSRQLSRPASMPKCCSRAFLVDGWRQRGEADRMP